MSMFKMSYSPIYGTIVFDTESKALYSCNQMTLVCYIFNSECNIIEDLVAFCFNKLSDFINVKLFIWITINTVILLLCINDKRIGKIML